jgi:cytochrome c551/c552
MKSHKKNLKRIINPGLIVIAILIYCIYATISGKALIQESVPSNPMSGRIVFEEKGCIDCHAIDGFGGDIGPDLGREKFFGSFYDLASRLWNHAPKMMIQSDLLEKGWPSITSTELNQLISYLFYLRYLGEPGNVSKGMQLIEDKACLNCHRIGDHGAPDGIALDQLKVYASPLYIAQVIWNHGPDMQKKMIAMGIERTTFDNEDITHISAYLREFSRDRSPKRQYMSPGNPKEGSKLFNVKGCSRCHATDEDQPSEGARLSEMNLHRSVTAIAGTMWNHGNTMWKAMQEEGIEWPTFEGSEMADLIYYLYFFDYQSSPGDSKLGKHVFQTKSCSKCHAPGEPLAFDRTIYLATPTDLVRTMWDHVPYMHELIITKNIEWPELTAEELRNLYAYLLQLTPEE